MISLARGFLKVSSVPWDVHERILIGLVGCYALKNDHAGLQQNKLLVLVQ